MKTFDFNPNSSSLDLINAYWMAKFSQLAYKDQKNIEIFNNSLGLNTRYFDKKNNELFIAYNNDLMIISFAGTDLKELQDVIDDIDAHCVRNVDCGCVHEGFYNRVINCYSWILEQLFDINSDGKQRKIWITGHSLGGGIAIVFTNLFSTLTKFKDNICGIYTFGQPRVGNRKFVKCYNKIFGNKTFKFVHACDCVPRLPSVFTGYRNNDTLVYINHEDKIQKLNFFQRCWDRLKDWFINLEMLKIAEIEEHFIGNYIKVLTNLICDHPSERT